MTNLPNTKSTTDTAELLFLRIFKVALIIFMGIALLAAIFLLIVAIYNFSQSPKEPDSPAQTPKQEITIEKLLEHLDPPKQEAPRREETTPVRPQSSPVLKYLEESTKMYRCSVDFARAVGLTVEEIDSKAAQNSIEDLRAQIERAADARETRGDPYVKNSAEFTCSSLKNPSVISLRKEKNVSGIFFKIINFHLKEWDRIQAEGAIFQEREQMRIRRERAEEEARVASARLSAITSLSAAAIAFGIFMLLALYLILSKIEGNLRPLLELKSLRAE